MLGANHIPESEPEANVTLANATVVDEDEFVCAFYNPDFIIYSSLGSFYIPCFVMIYLYARIFKVSLSMPDQEIGTKRSNWPAAKAQS